MPGGRTGLVAAERDGYDETFNSKNDSRHEEIHDGLHTVHPDRCHWFLRFYGAGAVLRQSGRIPGYVLFPVRILRRLCRGNRFPRLRGRNLKEDSRHRHGAGPAREGHEGIRIRRGCGAPSRILVGGRDEPSGLIPRYAAGRGKKGDRDRRRHRKGQEFKSGRPAATGRP